MTDLGQQGTSVDIPVPLPAPEPDSAAPAAPADPESAPPKRRFRRTRIVVYYLAAIVTFLMIMLLLAAWRDDHIISAHMGATTAEVLSAGRLRSAIAFVTPDGNTQTPKLGVLYPTNLTVGQTIDVQYATTDPDLVRVAGRDARVALIPVGSVIAVTWMIALSVLLLLRRLSRRRT